MTSEYIRAALTPLVGSATALVWAAPIARAARRHGITTARRLAYFLANALHESGGLAVLEEDLNYSAARLQQVWPTRFTPELAREIEGYPEAIANIVYQGRLGNDAPGDGWRYRGSGIFQLTGKSNHAAYARAAGVPLAKLPGLLRQAGHEAADSAAWFWASRGLNAHADAGDFREVVRRINGGFNGLQDREEWLERTESALTAAESHSGGLGEASRVIAFDWTPEDAWAILWASLGGQREVHLTGDYVWRAEPHANDPTAGTKLSIRRKAT
jgi:putative chitinase